MRLGWVTAALAFSLGLATTRAEAEPAYRLDAGFDVPVVLLGGAAASSFFLVDQSPGVVCGARCDRGQVNAFDRWAAGRYSTAWSGVGDVATATTVLFGPLVILFEEGFSDGLKDSVVVAEAALLSSALQVSLSYAVPRARPRVYSAEAPIEDRTDAIAARSFFSGHTANAVAVSVATSVTFRRLGKPMLGWFVLGAGLAGSSLVGTARILSGGHFPSDVAIGAAVGTGFGLLMPHLHSSNVRLAPLATADAGGLMLTGGW